MITVVLFTLNWLWVMDMSYCEGSFKKSVENSVSCICRIVKMLQHVLYSLFLSFSISIHILHSILKEGTHVHILRHLGVSSITLGHLKQIICRILKIANTGVSKITQNRSIHKKRCHMRK